MHTLNTTQIHTEHQQALMLCHDIEYFAHHLDAQNSYYRFQQSIGDLRHLLIHVHCPRERELTRHLRQNDATLLRGACPDDRHVDSIESLDRLEGLVDTAMNGILVRKRDIRNQAQIAVDSISHLIDLEERSCLPRADEMTPSADYTDTGEHHEA